MINHGTVRSTVKPSALEIDEYSAWVASNILLVQEEGTKEEPGFTGYQYDLVQYDKDEYIRLLDDKNASLESQMESTQEALDFLLLG
jgi:hypothetical protein